MKHRISRGWMALAAALVACGDNPTVAPGDDAPGATCGDGIVSGDEQCDGATDKTCFELGFSAGFPTCAADCTIDTGSCGRTTVSALAAHGKMACGVVDAHDGSHARLQCWGDGTPGAIDVPETGRLHSLAACDFTGGYCGIDAEGQIACANSNADYVPAGNTYQRVWCDTRYGLVLAQTTDGALISNGAEAATGWRVPRGKKVRDVLVRSQCVLFDDDSVTCADPAVEALVGGEAEHALWESPDFNGLRMCGVTAAGLPWCRVGFTGVVAPIPAEPLGYRQLLSIVDSTTPGAVHVCALGGDGSVACDRQFQDSFMSLPPAGVRFTALALTRAQTPEPQLVGLASDGTIYAWGRGALRTWSGSFEALAPADWDGMSFAALARDGRVLSHHEVNGPQWSDPQATPVQISLSPRLGCATYSDGHLACWGHGGFVPFLARGHLRGVYTDVYVSSSGSTICARGGDGIVECPGRIPDFVPPPPTPQVAVAAHPNGGCFVGLDAAGGVARWGALDVFCLPLPHPDGYSTVSVSAGRLTCGLRAGIVECATGVAAAPTIVLPGTDWIDVRALDEYVCAVSSGGEVACARLAGGVIQAMTIYEEAGTPDRVVRFAGLETIMGVRVSGRPAPLALAPTLDPLTLSGAREVIGPSLGSSTTPSMCARTSDGAVRCNGVPNVVAPADATDVSVAGTSVCWRIGGAAACLSPGTHLDGPLAFSQPVHELAQNALAACAVVADGSLACISSGVRAGVQAVPTAGAYHGLRAGAEVFCALDADDHPACFDERGAVDPGLPSRLRIVAPGFEYAHTSNVCGIDLDDHLACTGALAEAMPSDAGTAHWRALQVVDNVACGTRLDGRASCWGTFSGVLAPATGEYQLADDEHVVVSAFATCRQRPGRAPVCRGVSRY